MARYIAGFSREARKSGRFRWFHHPSRRAYGVWTSTTHPQLSRYGQTPKTIPGQTADGDLTGSVLSISEHSADIFWQQQAAPAAAAEQLVAAAVAPDGRSGGPDAVVAVGPPEGVAVRPFGAVAVLASPSAEPDAAVVAAAAQPGVVAQPVEFAAEASARPAGPALEARLRIWAAVVAVAAAERLAVAPFPERPALLQGPEPSRQLSAAPPEVPAPFPALLEHPLFPGDSGPPEVPSLAGLVGQVSRWDSASLEQVPSPPAAPEAPLCCPGLAEYWLSVTLGLEAAHWGLRWRATAYLALLSDQAVCRERPAWLRD
jgi:hypothetical protein